MKNFLFQPKKGFTCFRKYAVIKDGKGTPKSKPEPEELVMSANHFQGLNASTLSEQEKSDSSTKVNSKDF